MKIEFCDYNEETNVMTIDADEEGKELLMAEGVAYLLLKGFHNMDDKDALVAFQTFADLHLRMEVTPVEEIPDSWAYWSPGDIK